MSAIEDRVCEKIQTRAAFGLRKYGVTLERNDLSYLDWLRHHQEELLDAAGYVEVEIQHLEKEYRETEGKETKIPRTSLLGRFILWCNK